VYIICPLHCSEASVRWSIWTYTVLFDVLS